MQPTNQTPNLSTEARSQEVFFGQEKRNFVAK